MLKRINYLSSINSHNVYIKLMATNTQEILVLAKGDGVNKDIHIDFSLIKRASLTLRALNHRLRKQIVNLIEENGKLAVTEIYVKLRLEQSVASQHLAILRRAGVVKTQRDGKHIYYTLNKQRIQEIMDMVPDLAQG